MKTLTAFALGSILFGSAFLTGCSEDVSHTHKDSPDWLDNGHTKTDTTTTKNPDGTTSTSESKTHTNN